MNTDSPLLYKFSFLSNAVVILALLVGFATCYYATPTIFGGRDQGAIATAAINLAKHKSFAFSTPVSEDLFQKYGPGKALNYPGFDYTKDGELITRFPKVYITYLAGCYWLFGLEGIRFANFIPLFLFFILFWLTLRQFFSEKISFLGFLITATFFPFLWFAKYALTEIFMLFLIWTGMYFLILYRKSVDARHLQVTLAAFALSALTRIEGIIFFLLAITYIVLLNNKKIITLPKNFNRFLLTSTLFLLILYLFLNFPALLDSAKNIAKLFLPDTTKDSAPSANLYSRLLTLFVNYNLLAYLVLGLAGIFWLLKNLKKNWAKSEYLIILILFPSFIYLILPTISLDDPWIFRRYVFAVFPALIFYAIYFLNRFFRHKTFLYFTFIILIIANGFVSWRFITLSENRSLLPQVEKFSQKFSPDDLILVDRMATGSGYSLASEPMQALYNKNAVYFFNADDLKYIDQNRYKNIYLIAPPAGENSWYADLIKNKNFDIEIIANNFLEPSEKKWALAENIELRSFVGIWKIK